MQLEYTRRGYRKFGVAVGRLPTVMFVVWAALVPFDNVLSLGELGTLTKLLAMAMAVAIVTDRLTAGNGVILRPSWPVLGWSAFVALMIASTFWSVSPSITLGNAETITGLFGVYAVVALVPWSPSVIRKLRAAVVLGGVAASLIALYTFLHGYGFLGTERASLVLMGDRATDPNHFSASLILPLMFALSGLMNEKKNRLVLASSALIMGVAMMSSGSRGATVGALGGVASLLWAHRRSMKGTFALALVTALVLILAAVVLRVDLVSRYSLQSVLVTGGAGRLSLWKLGWKAFLEKPLFGWGYGVFPLLSQGLIHAGWHVKSGLSAHSIYVQTLAEMGAVGGLVLVATLWLQYSAAARPGRQQPFFEAVAAATTGIFITGATLGILNYKYFWFIQMLDVMRLGSPTRESTLEMKAK